MPLAMLTKGHEVQPNNTCNTSRILCDFAAAALQAKTETYGLSLNLRHLSHAQLHIDGAAQQHPPAHMHRSPICAASALPSLHSNRDRSVCPFGMLCDALHADTSETDLSLITRAALWMRMHN